jgi:hypothetical protein
MINNVDSIWQSRSIIHHHCFRLMLRLENASEMNIPHRSPAPLWRFSSMYWSGFHICFWDSCPEGAQEACSWGSTSNGLDRTKSWGTSINTLIPAAMKLGLLFFATCNCHLSWVLNRSLWRLVNWAGGELSQFIGNVCMNQGLKLGTIIF